MVRPDDLREIRGEKWYRARGIIDQMVGKEIESVRRSMGEDPLLNETGAADSPGLERYRMAKADLAEMERDRQRRRIVRIDQIELTLMQLATVLRDAGERIARQYGNDAADILNEAVDDWRVGVRKLIDGDSGTDSVADATPGGGDSSAKTSDDAAVC